MNNKTKKTIKRKTVKRTKIYEVVGQFADKPVHRYKSAESMLSIMMAAKRKNEYTHGVIYNPDGSAYRLNLTQIALPTRKR